MNGGKVKEKMDTRWRRGARKERTFKENQEVYDKQIWTTKCRMSRTQRPQTRLVGNDDGAGDDGETI